MYPSGRHRDAPPLDPNGPIQDDGATLGYTVDELPEGHEAWIDAVGLNTNSWKILQYKNGVRTHRTDIFNSAKEALAVLQTEYDAVAA